MDPGPVHKSLARPGQPCLMRPGPRACQRLASFAGVATGLTIRHLDADPAPKIFWGAPGRQGLGRDSRSARCSSELRGARSAPPRAFNQMGVWRGSDPTPIRRSRGRAYGEGDGMGLGCYVIAEGQTARHRVVKKKNEKDDKGELFFLDLKPLMGVPFIAPAWRETRAPGSPEFRAPSSELRSIR